MSDHTVIVTGGAQGIGKAIAIRLAADGYGVVIADIDRVAGRETVEEIGNPERVTFVETNVADEASVQRMVRQSVERDGTLTALVNNAAIANPHTGRIEELQLDDWNRVLDTNLTGSFLCTKHSAAHLRASTGAIVNIASTRAIMSEPHTEAYSAAKGGLVALTHALANSLAPDVRVNCVSPGWIATQAWQRSDRRREPELRPEDHAQHLTGRVGTPGDIAAIIAFLLSSEAGFVTGQQFVADGGMTRKMIYR
ncbi:MAG: glucose 1-dehydrogenase [Rhodothermales bacterium]